VARLEPARQGLAGVDRLGVGGYGSDQTGLVWPAKAGAAEHDMAGACTRRGWCGMARFGKAGNAFDNYGKHNKITSASKTFLDNVR
jgi:hypothetical protein